MGGNTKRKRLPPRGGVRLSGNSRPPFRRGPKYVYPWGDWFTLGTEWWLEEGVEYTCARDSMIHLIRKRATQLGVRVSIYQEENGLLLISRGRRRT